MSHAVTPWLAVTIFLAFMALLVVWTRRQSILRPFAVACALFSAPAAAVAIATPLGWPVPLYGGLTALGGEYPVLGVKMIAGKAIYVLVDTGDEPRYYMIPWDRELADQLQDILDDPGNEGAKIEIPMEFSWDKNKPQFHPLPQMKVLPDKPPQERAPHVDA